MRPVDKLIGAYVGFFTVIIVVRGVSEDSMQLWLLVAHALIAVLFFAFTKLEPQHRAGQIIQDLYPLLLLPAFYAELGMTSLLSGMEATFARDAAVQGWEATIFGGQISYYWIRQFPSVFWSGILHLAYVLYYPIIVIGPVLLVARGRSDQGRKVLLATMIAFIACYIVFALYPVAGPNYTFEHPTGPVREVWSARLVYWLLSHGSAFGTAFPSSHVAATVATTTALWQVWRGLALVVVLPTILLVIGTVYCQMHYGIDAAVGIAIGAAAGAIGTRISA